MYVNVGGPERRQRLAASLDVADPTPYICHNPNERRAGNARSRDLLMLVVVGVNGTWRLADGTAAPEVVVRAFRLETARMRIHCGSPRQTCRRAEGISPLGDGRIRVR
jgi:hypothetical protein